MSEYPSYMLHTYIYIYTHISFLIFEVFTCLFATTFRALKGALASQRLSCVFAGRCSEPLGLGCVSLRDPQNAWRRVATGCREKVLAAVFLGQSG